MKITLETTADGSPTLYREDIDEHYHSVKGAFTESMHVYIDSGWRKAAGEISSPVKVLEVGFGTGLNAALTAREANKLHRPTIYHSIELYPLPLDTALQFARDLNDEYRNPFIEVNQAEWNIPVSINSDFTLVKIIDNLLTMNLPENIDVVYFDAFAPEKQPEMWEKSVFQKIYDAMNLGGILATYCAKGAIRRMLQEIGFITERLSGPPGGKREILRATKFGNRR